MQNTKTEYSRYERTPVVLPEMEQLLPPLSEEQLSAFGHKSDDHEDYTMEQTL